MRLLLSVLVLTFAVGLLLTLYYIGYLAPQNLAEVFTMKGSVAQQQEAAEKVIRQIFIYVSLELATALLVVIILALYVNRSRNVNVVYMGQTEQAQRQNSAEESLQIDTDEYIVERLTQQIRRLTEEAEKFGQAGTEKKPLLEKLLSTVCHAVDAVTGVCFRVNPHEKTVHAVAGFALSEPLPEEPFAYGEGFAGQTAQSGKPMYVYPVPEDYMPVKTGLGSAQPASLLFLPVVKDNQTLGVIELGLFRQVSEKLLENLQKNIHLSSPLFSDYHLQPDAN